ncbi:YjjG family noncanonical pyrimidine nucleotidase [Lacrimispora sp.]|uniref:YjjG family noncanonical pyrimidine nucleotidase n=1 Tax=Lacrimispora sp. TaxID=2719234 RepID=UPI00399385CE
MYQFYLLDIDNTLLNFDTAEIHSFQKLLDSYHITYEDELFHRYKKINKNLWNLLEQGKVDKDTVLTGRFKEFFAYCGLDIDPAEAENRYRSNLNESCDLMPHAEDTLFRLKSEGKKLYSASNGVYITQIKRLEAAGLFQYFDGMFISEEIGYEKPHKSFFDHCFENIRNFDKSKAIMVGDSLTSDIEGAYNSGIDSCLYTPKGSTVSSKATHTICDLRELLSL